MHSKETNIVLFDGVCNLCNSTVQFIIRYDPKAKFKFASIQSGRGQLLMERHGLPIENTDSLIFISDKRVYIKSTAVLMILQGLSGGWKLLFGLIIIPGFLRDRIYDFIAKRRYRYFGKSESCIIPAPEYQERFIE